MKIIATQLILLCYLIAPFAFAQGEPDVLTYKCTGLDDYLFLDSQTRAARISGDLTFPQEVEGLYTFPNAANEKMFIPESAFTELAPFTATGTSEGHLVRHQCEPVSEPPYCPDMGRYLKHEGPSS